MSRTEQGFSSPQPTSLPFHPIANVGHGVHWNDFFTTLEVVSFTRPGYSSQWARAPPTFRRMEFHGYEPRTFRGAFTGSHSTKASSWQWVRMYSLRRPMAFIGLPIRPPTAQMTFT